MTENISTNKGISSIHNDSDSVDITEINNSENNVLNCDKLNGGIPGQSALGISYDSINDKKSFHITSVTVQRNSADGNADESADESRTEELFDNIDMSTVDVQIETSKFPENIIKKDDVLYKVASVGSAPIIPTSAQYGIAVVSNPNSDLSDSVSKLVSIDKLNDFVIKNDYIQNGLENNYTTNVSNNVINKEYNIKNERFKVVKIESNEPFRRGRWVCMDFLDQSMDQVKKSTDISTDNDINKKEVDSEILTSEIIVNTENMANNNDMSYKITNEIENKILENTDATNHLNGDILKSVSPNQTFTPSFAPLSNLIQSQAQSLTHIIIPQQTVTPTNIQPSGAFLPPQQSSLQPSMIQQSTSQASNQQVLSQPGQAQAQQIMQQQLQTNSDSQLHIQSLHQQSQPQIISQQIPTQITQQQPQIQQSQQQVQSHQQKVQHISQPTVSQLSQQLPQSQQSQQQIQIQQQQPQPQQQLQQQSQNSQQQIQHHQPILQISPQQPQQQQQLQAQQIIQNQIPQTQNIQSGIQHQSIQQATPFSNTQQPSQQPQSSPAAVQQPVQPQVIPSCVQQQQMPQIQQSLSQQNTIQSSSQPLQSGSLQPSMQHILPPSVQPPLQQIQPSPSINGGQAMQQSYVTTQLNDQNIPASSSQVSQTLYQLDVMLPQHHNQTDLLITPNQVPQPNQYAISQPQNISVPAQIPLHVSVHQPYSNSTPQSANHVNTANTNLTSTSSQSTPPISQQQFYNHSVSQSMPPPSQTSCSVSSQDLQHLCMHPHQIMSSVSQPPLISSMPSQTVQSAIQSGGQQQQLTQNLNVSLSHQNQIPYSVHSQHIYPQNGSTSQISSNVHTQTTPISQSCSASAVSVQQYTGLQPSVQSLNSVSLPVSTVYASNVNVIHQSTQLPQQNYVHNVVSAPQIYSSASHNPCNITFSDVANVELCNQVSSQFLDQVSDTIKNNEEIMLQRPTEDVDSTVNGNNAVAIDNKIEQAMDLVKSHLMFAVREEVEVLKEKIAELMDRINQLEIENSILKANASQETIDLLPKLSIVTISNVPCTQAQFGPTSNQPP
ncbi:hypothetical protein PGB90_001711 [Kerria lacca]